MAARRGEMARCRYFVIFSAISLTIFTKFACSDGAAIHGLRINGDQPSNAKSGELLQDTPTELLLFGSGYKSGGGSSPAKNTTTFSIKFTTIQAFRLDDCSRLSTSEAIDAVAKSDNVATATVRLKPSHDPYYLCLYDLEAGTYIHQGTDSWLTIRAIAREEISSILPLWLQILLIAVLLCLSGLFSGLNLGLMSLDRTELKIVESYGGRKEKKFAKVIRPVRNRGNFLLCTLLLGNVLVNSTLTIFLDDISSGLVAIIGSTMGIVIFGEIIPQAICSRHGLAVGAKTIWLTKIFMIITFPLSYPISKLLDLVLGEELGHVYSREKLQGLIKVTKDFNTLENEEANIIEGALELSKKTVRDIMTPLDDVFMLTNSAILNFETISNIMEKGYTRVPVYDGTRANVVALLSVKDLAFLDPSDNIPVVTLCRFYNHPIMTVFDDTTLEKMLEEFKRGKSHMSFVSRVNREGENDPYYEIIGLVTLEDIIEEIILDEIVDETDTVTDNVKRAPRHGGNIRRDFSMFAQEMPQNEISPQLAFAAFQFLFTMVEPFQNGMISVMVMKMMLKQDVICHHKLKEDVPSRHREGMSKEEREETQPNLENFLYERGKPADYFIMILEGHAKVHIGQEEMTFESGPFSCYGMQAINVVNNSLSKLLTASAEQMNIKSLPSYIPDYSLEAITSCLYLRIKRSHYLAARRATIMMQGKEEGVASTSNSSPQHLAVPATTQINDDAFINEWNKVVKLTGEDTASDIIITDAVIENLVAKGAEGEQNTQADVANNLPPNCIVNNVPGRTANQVAKSSDVEISIMKVEKEDGERTALLKSNRP